MNLPNKITFSRIILAIIILIIMVFPFNQIGFNFPTSIVAGKVIVDFKYILCGGLFIIASLTDLFDGYLARKNKMVTDTGKIMDAIADKILVNGILVVLATDGFIPSVVPVVIITRDIIVDAIKMSVGSKGHAVGASILGKIKTVCMLIGISITLLYNLPFELIGLKLGMGLIFLATVLSVISGVQYYNKNKTTMSNS